MDGAKTDATTCCQVTDVLLSLAWLGHYHKECKFDAFVFILGCEVMLIAPVSMARHAC